MHDKLFKWQNLGRSELNESHVIVYHYDQSYFFIWTAILILKPLILLFIANFIINRDPSIPEIQLFQDLTKKILGHGLGWGQNQGHIVVQHCINSYPFRKTRSLTQLDLCQGYIMVLTSYSVSAIWFHANQQHPITDTGQGSQPPYLASADKKCM